MVWLLLVSIAALLYVIFRLRRALQGEREANAKLQT